MTPDLDELLSTARVVALPMTTRFRGVDEREALLFEGPQGWAEFSPFVEYADAEAAVWLAASIDYAWNTQPAPVRERIPVNATVPAVGAERVAEVLARFPGCRTAKVKVAESRQSLADDVDRVHAVREALGPEGRVRIDANANWNVDEAERALHALAEFDLEYAEQPCASVEELAELHRRVKYMGIPIAADESIRKAEDPLAVARAGAADLIVIKAQPLGGIRRALEIVSEAGLAAVVSSALDTAVGLSQGAALAAVPPPLGYDCGPGTGALFAEDVADLSPVDGAIPVGRVTPDAARLDRLAASDDRRDWWLDRLRRCHALLAASDG
ncbi:o-succinylbenzoate synthase [Microbacterium tenebrionis]|uniref:o-succinylbenzoate synthase n=1 Tax=Microbacterium tenebrionis TaxID=2830665 RepID=UPI00158D7022|nr:o-succinylbenzoate synthase [Microbacterium ihumii]